MHDFVSWTIFFCLFQLYAFFSCEFFMYGVFFFFFFCPTPTRLIGPRGIIPSSISCLSPSLGDKGLFSTANIL